MKRHEALALRRELLVAEARLQRLQWRLRVQSAQAAMRPEALLPRAVAQARAHPAALAAAVAAALLLRRVGLRRLILAVGLWKRLTSR